MCFNSLIPRDQRQPLHTPALIASKIQTLRSRTLHFLGTIFSVMQLPMYCTVLIVPQTCPIPCIYPLHPYRDTCGTESQSCLSVFMVGGSRYYVCVTGQDDDWLASNTRGPCRNRPHVTFWLQLVDTHDWDSE